MLPNTKITRELLSPATILCCGEDPSEFEAELKKLHGEKPRLEHSFRNYRVQKFEDFSVIIAPIGTGCLEPLLFEVAQCNVVQRLLLVGTAGATPAGVLESGQAYWINEAFVLGTGLDSTLGNSQALKPSFEEKPQKLPEAKIVSTDFYYGVSTVPMAEYYRNCLPDIQERTPELLARAQLIDMEVGQFFALCQFIFSLSPIKYGAIKGPANSLGNPRAQLENSGTVIGRCLAAAMLCLGVTARPATTQAVAIPGNMDKMVEEIKLYWTIQTACGSVLGYLATKVEASNSDSGILVLLIGFLILCIGAIYNIVGNFYVRLEGQKLGRVREQENVISPALAGLYLIIASAIGYLLGNYLEAWFMVLADKGYTALVMAFSLVAGTMVYFAMRRLGLKRWLGIIIGMVCFVSTRAVILAVFGFRVEMGLGFAVALICALALYGLQRSVHQQLLKMKVAGYAEYSSWLRNLLFS